MSRPHCSADSNAHGCAEFRFQSRWTRRQALMIGGLTMSGLSLPQLLAAQARQSAGAGQQRRARSCIFVFAWGGPSQLDTWDLKPGAPEEVRGEFQPISTNVPGIQISEHFPRLARLADKYAIIRSMTHDDPAHLSSVHHLTTGRIAPVPKSDADGPSRRDTPHLGSMLARLRPSGSEMPPFVTLPWIVSHPAAPGGIAPGQNGGWLGAGFDPFVVAGDPNASDFTVGGLTPNQDVPEERLHRRRELLARINAESTFSGELGHFHARAFDLLTSPAAQRAFQIDREPARVRDRYGRNIHGQCLLLARRLIEAGVQLVSVNWHQDGQNFWDTHGNNFNRLKNDLMPPTDIGLSMLLEDLDARGMLEETLVVWVGEFGRKPQITRGNAGREHWPFCYSGVLAGGGIRGGQVYGASDRLAAYPTENPVSPADFTASIYHALGIDTEQMIHDRENRPIRLTEGTPIRALFG